MTNTERRWISVSEFAAYLGVSTDQVYKMVHTDPDVQRVSRRFGRRLLICLYAWQESQEREMVDGRAVAEPRGTGAART